MILVANPLITDPDRIFVGQIIYLPVVPPAAAVPAAQSSSVSIAAAPPNTNAP